MSYYKLAYINNLLNYILVQIILLMASSFLSLPSLLLFLFLTITSLLVHSSSSKPPRPVHLPRTGRVGFRIGLTRVDHGRNLTKFQLVERSVRRGKLRLERLAELATPTGPGKGIRAPVFSGDGEFLMNFTVGSPAVPVSAIMDTGSDLIWTQCMPCTKCFDQPTPVFDPVKSSSLRNISCTSELCEDPTVFKCDHGCKYLYIYGDESSTRGYMAKDTFIFGDSASVHNVVFGCGVNNQGLGLAEGSGLVGLGRGPLSLVSQLDIDKFSYCLTSMGENKTSQVLFGALADLNYSATSGKTRSTTPLVQNPFQPSFYYVSLKGITVGKTRVRVPKSTRKPNNKDGSGGMILDSGTTLTYLDEDVFGALKKEFTSQMKLGVSKRPGATGLDLCFDLPTTTDVSEVAVPKLKLHFEGSDLELPEENYMIADSWDGGGGVVCLAMAASSGGLSIFGNIAQQNLLVLHDLEEETVSFTPTQCDQL